MPVPESYRPKRDPFAAWWRINPDELTDQDVVIRWVNLNCYPVIANPAYPMAKELYNAMALIGRGVYAVCNLAMKPFKDVSF